MSNFSVDDVNSFFFFFPLWFIWVFFAVLSFLYGGAVWCNGGLTSKVSECGIVVWYSLHTRRHRDRLVFSVWWPSRAGIIGTGTVNYVCVIVNSWPDHFPHPVRPEFSSWLRPGFLRSGRGIRAEIRTYDSAVIWPTGGQCTSGADVICTPLAAWGRTWIL